MTKAKPNAINITRKGIPHEVLLDNKEKPLSPDDPNLPIERWKEFSRKLPYGIIKTGFIVHPENNLLLIPDKEQIFFLEQAFDYLSAGNSLREVSEWVTQKLHKTVSHQTLSNLYKAYRSPFTTVPTKKKSPPKISREGKKLIAEKNRARAAVKKAEKLEREIHAKRHLLKKEDIPSRVIEEKVYTLATGMNENRSKKILFEANPGPQSEFLQAPELEVLYGGAAGGGKSYAMIADPMRHFGNGNFVGLLLRRTNDELRELVRETQKLYPKGFPGAKWNQQKSSWTFPSGAEFWITYLDRDDDVLRYQGQAFTWIGMDELTQYPTPFAYEYLKSRLRSSDPELQKSLAMRSTSNPGGPGHQWVKKMFVDPEVPGVPFWARDLDTGEIITYPENFRDPTLAGKPISKRLFIPARLSDNPYLYNDGSYEKNLLTLPEAQRRKLLDGDWSVMEGAAFPEFSSVHVCEPFEVPNSWRKFRAGDFGYSSFSAVLWFAIDPNGTLYVYRELYVSKKTGQELAQLIRKAEQEDMNMAYGVLDSSVWAQRGHVGPSIAEEMIRAGCSWRRSDRTAGSRVAGKNRLHELLRIDPMTGKPGIIFFNTCRQMIADLPMLPADPDGTDDIDVRFKSDHTYDALRYGIMSRPKVNIWGEEWENRPTQKYRPANATFGY